MATTGDLQYSQDGLSNRELFLSDFNDINIYVEDTGKEYEYEEIFERLFSNQIKILSIFPLGGKSALVDEFHKVGAKGDDGRPRVYIVDGDFDLLWPDQRINNPNFIYLTRYNIESYFISKNVVTRFMRTRLKCKRCDAEARINYDYWKNSMVINLYKLFVLFATVKKYKPEHQNVNIGSSKFLSEFGDVLQDRYDEYYSTVKAIFPNVDEQILTVKKIMDIQSNGEIFTIICGKYLFDSICRYLHHTCGKNINYDQFRAFLINNFDITQLNFLKEKIYSLLGKPFKNTAYSS